MQELRHLIETALKKGYRIVEVQMPLSIVKAELKGELLLDEPTTRVVGTLFGYPFRDMPYCSVITI